MKPYYFRMIIVVACFFIGSSQAHEDPLTRFQWHGFLSQGYFNTTDNNYFGDSQNGSFDLTEIGLSASYRASDSLLLAGQVLSRNAGDMYKASPSVDLLLADYTFNQSGSAISGIRIGRTKNILGLYNDTRDVAFTRPGILVPQVIYFDKVRNLVLSSDGVMFYHDMFTSVGNISLTLGGGQTVLDKNVEIAYLFEDRAGKLETDGITWLASSFFTTPDERLKLGLSAAVSSMRYRPADVDVLSAGNTSFTYWIASFQYNREKWTVSAEYMQEPVEWKQYGPFVPDNKATAEAFYVQGAYRLKPTLELMIRVEEGYADKDDKNGQNVELLSGGSIPAFSQFSKITTTGLRWDITPGLMVRFEYQQHRGTFILSSRENETPADLSKNWEVFSILASYRF